MLYSVIKQKGAGEFVRVGIVAKNDAGEIMLVSDNIDRINKSIMSIPYVDVKEFREEDIIREFNNKYGIKIISIKNYINETNFLDEMCNERLQVNMTCDFEKNDIQRALWRTPQDILNNSQVTSNIKECIEVYNYNTTEGY